MSAWFRRRGRMLIMVFMVFSGTIGFLGSCETMPVTRGWLDEVRGGFKMPPFATINRNLPMGLHSYTRILPGIAHSPAMKRVEPDDAKREEFIKNAKVRIAMNPDYAHIDVKEGVVLVSWWYYHAGADLHLYLDLMHELTHIRQLRDGADLWDAKYSYAQRPTEIEAYAVATEEGRRLGMTPAQIEEHLHNPWMTDADVAGLTKAIDVLLAQPLGTPVLPAAQTVEPAQPVK